MDEPAIINCAELAKRMGISTSALHKWYSDDATLAGCILRQNRRTTWWSVQKLRDRGFLIKPEMKTIQSVELSNVG